MKKNCKNWKTLSYEFYELVSIPMQWCFCYSTVTPDEILAACVTENRKTYFKSIDINVSIFFPFVLSDKNRCCLCKQIVNPKKM